MSAPATGRDAPASTSEPYVLGCCLLDDGASLAAALASGLSASDFEHPTHRTIFAELAKMAGEGVPIGLDTLLPRLPGVPATTLMALADPVQIGTTARLGHHVREMQYEAIRRRIIVQSRLAIEAAERGEDVTEIKSLLQFEHSDPADDQLLARAYDHGRRHPKPRPVYTAGGTTICTPGNLTTLYSQAKAGKSALLGGMLAASMVDAGASAAYDCLGMTGPNPQKHAVIHLDTEQSPYDWQQCIGTVLRRAKMDAPPPWFMSYNLTGLPAHECQRVLSLLLRRGRKLHGGIHSVHLDGIGDLVVDPNSSEECFPLVTRLHGLAIEFATAIISVLHLNPGSDEKGRGHLGSQLERKSESNLMMENRDGVSTYWGTKQRGKIITKSDAIAFRWSDEAQMHVSAQTPDTKPGRGGRPAKHTIHDFWECIPSKPMPGGQIHRMAVQLREIKLSTFKDLLAEAAKDGTLRRTYDEKTGFSYQRGM